CNNVCSLPRSIEICENGGCGVGSCEEGFGNCDGVANNGCEINFLNDEANCGGCNIVCNIASSEGVCIDGDCHVGSCEGTRRDCDLQVANGCETDIANDVANCGGCNVACNVPNAFETCGGSQCAIASCEGNFDNCD